MWMSIYAIRAAPPPDVVGMKTWLNHPPQRPQPYSICKQYHGTSLALGVNILKRATLSQLQSHSFLLSVVRSIGLFPANCPWCAPLKGILPSYYGWNTKYALQSHFAKGADGYVNDTDYFPVGLWQQPEQIVCAMLHLSTREITSVMTYGTFSGWTDSVLFTYLKRLRQLKHVDTLSRFVGVTVDSWDQLTPCVRQVLVEFGRFEFRIRSQSTNLATELLYDRGFPPKFDLCFIDAGHSYKEVLNDVREVLSSCNGFMFHDVLQSAGVRKFWQQVSGKGVAECIMQPDAHGNGKRMGIGLAPLQAVAAAIYEHTDANLKIQHGLRPPVTQTPSL